MQFYNDYSQKEKSYFRVAMAVLLVGLIFVLFAMAFSYIIEAKKTAKSYHNLFQMSFSGEGKVAAKPDMVLLNVTIVSERPSVSAAQAENTAAFNKAAKFLENLNVDKKDIKTTNYSINPQYFYPENRKPEITGYQVRNSMEIKIRDLTKVDDILGGLVENGANEISNVIFTIDNPEKLKTDARKLAIAAAKAKAAALSKDLGVRLKRIAGFAENEGGFPPMPVFYKAEAMGMSRDSGSAGPDLSGGEQEISVTVTITYEFASR